MLPRFLPSVSGSSTSACGSIQASAHRGTVGGWLHCTWAWAGTPQCCLRIHHYPVLGVPAAPREYSFGWTHVFWDECNLLYFSVRLFFFLKRDFRRGSYISAIFELSLWSLTLFFFFMSYSLPTAASLFELTGLNPSAVWLHLKSVQNHKGWVWTMYLFVMLQLVALVMIIMCHKENILSLCTEQTAGTF